MKMKKIFAFVMLAAMCFLKAYAADDFYYSLDLNALDTGDFIQQGWECEGGVTVQTVDRENALNLPENSAAVFMPDSTITNNRVVLKMQITPLTDTGFTGVYLFNSSGKACFSLSLNKNGVFAVYTAGAWHTLLGYEQGQMYDVECILNIEQSKFDILIDGAAYITGAAFRHTPEIQQLKIYTEKACVQVRNLRLYSNTVVGIGIDGTAVYGCETVPAGLSEIYIDFCKDIDADTLNADNVILRDNTSGAVIPCTGEYIAEQRRYVLTPQTRYNKDAALSLTVLGGENGVRAVNGGIISGSSVMLGFDALKKPAEVENAAVTENADSSTLELTVKNLTSLNIGQSIFIATFSGGRLLDCSEYTLSEAPHSESVFVSDAISTDAEQIYAYIFDMGGMIPVCEKIVIKPAEGEI